MMIRLCMRTSWSRLAALAVLASLVAAAGCSNGRYPVKGRVTYPDGSPLTEGNVIGQMGEGATSVTVQGRVKSDGSFSWGTERAGDGAAPGKYRVIVVARALGDSELAQGMRPAVDAKFANPQTSGIEFEVKPGRNQLNVTVTRPAGRKR
jgi:hypothetical protein